MNSYYQDCRREKIYCFSMLQNLKLIPWYFVFCRLPKKDNTRDFETLKETPDDWKSDEQ